MDKEDVVHGVCVCVYNGILLNQVKRNSAICNTVDGLGGHYGFWNVRQKKTDTVWYCLYVESKKYDQLMHKTKKKQIHWYKEQFHGYQSGQYIDRGIKCYYESIWNHVCEAFENYKAL